MANYYNFTIKSDKITQEVASDIFTQASTHNKITHFEFSEGHIFMYSRGVPDVADVLEKYNITDDELSLKDEFEAFWGSLPEEELKEIINNYEIERENLQKEMTEVFYD